MLIDTAILKLASKIDARTQRSGQLFNDSTGAIVISSLSGTTPVVVTTATAHGLVSGDEVYIIGNAGTPLINNFPTNSSLSHVVTVTGVTTFTVAITFVSDAGAKGTVTPARIGSSRGAFEPQQILAFYNDARNMAFLVLRAKYGNDLDTLHREVGSLLLSAAVTFSGASPATATLPTGYIDFATLNDGTGVIPLVGADMLEGILAARPNWTQSATNRHVYQQGALLLHSSTFVSGSCTLKYFGITDWTLTQLLSGTATETFGDQHLQGILELAQLLALESGGAEVAAVAKKLFGI